MRSRALLLLAAAGLSAGCGRCGSRPPVPKTGPRAVAVVNGETITTKALKRELDHARAAGAEGGSPDGVLRRRLLDDAVERALLLQQAHARSITVGQEQLTVEKLFADEVFPGVQVTEADVARHYAEHAADFEQPQQVRASQIVVRTREEAQKLREELRRRPRSFADVAARASLSPEGKAGGDLGWFGKGSGMPEVFDACFKLPLNAVSEVTPSPYGFHLFKVTARRPAQRRPLDEVRPVIYDKLLREGRAGAQETYLAALRKKAQIQIDETALGAVAP